MKPLSIINKIFNKNRPIDKLEYIYCDDRNKALARYIVREVFPKKLDGDGITEKSDKSVHLIVAGTDSLLMNIARQVILNCHFPNFNENTGEHRTKVTFIAENAGDVESLKAVKQDLCKVLGRLPEYCACLLHNDDWSVRIDNPNAESYIDVEIEVIGLSGISAKDYIKDKFKPADNELTTLVAYKSDPLAKVAADIYDKYYQIALIDPDIVNTGDDKLLIATNGAQLVNWIYCIGLDLNNIIAKDIEQVNIYAPYIKAYTTNNDYVKMLAEWDKLDDLKKISNVLCVDGFEYRLRSVGTSMDETSNAINRAIKKNLPQLARVEHYRWTVERLTMGYRPLNSEELWEDGNLNGAKRDEWRKQMKEKLIHIDICAYRTLCRIDPDAVKHDSFIVLAIPHILSKI